jgi:hypothetical protein
LPHSSISIQYIYYWAIFFCAMVNSIGGEWLPAQKNITPGD